MIVKNKYFNIKQIADSGQCFRMKQLEDNYFSLIAYGKYVELRQLDEETVEICCEEEEYKQIWEDYFDLKYDYGVIVTSLLEGEDEFLKKAVGYGKGIRILRQEPFEMLISYIISQNKNIPSIKNCISRICEKYGKPVSHLKGKKDLEFTFPEPKDMVRASKQELRAMKLGYRDDYIMNAAQTIMQGNIMLQDLINCSHEEAIQTLKKIHGVGDKVANCISLYGLHHIEAFPVDVWIKKVLNDVYHNHFNVEQYAGYAGIIQQYMFYYMRNLAK